MAVVYVSEAEAIHDFASILARVRAGTQVVIENEEAVVALVNPAVSEAEEPEPGYHEWFEDHVHQVLDKGPHERISEEDAEAIMAQHRRSAAATQHGSAA